MTTPHNTSGTVTEHREAIVTNFFNTMYPTGTTGCVNLWTDTGHRSNWFSVSDPKAMATAAEFAITANEAGQVWYMTGLTASDLGERSKGREADIVCLPGLHADVDISDPVHKKAAHLPPTLQDAQKIVAAFPLPPTLIVHSGHGLQPHWLFDHPADTSTPEQSERIKALLTRLQKHLRDAAAAQGWTLDSTHNLDRLMRIPGTFNCKAEPVPVKVIESNGTRYSVEQLEAALNAITPAPLPDEDEIDFSIVSVAESVAVPQSGVITDDDGWNAVANDDDKIVAAARNAKNGAKFSRLFDGDAQGYSSPSEAVEALACLVVFWTRDRFQIRRIMDASKLCKGYEKWSRKDIPDRCIDAALKHVKNTYDPDRITGSPADAHTDNADAAKRSQADALVRLANDAELFHDSNNAAFASVTVNEHVENHAVMGKSFAGWLLGRYWQQNRKAPSSKAVDDAIDSIVARAQFEGAKHEVAIRLAEHDGKVYLDLCNDGWEAVEVTAEGWAVVSRPPVPFIRKSGMLPLPTPMHGGSLGSLRPLINASDDNTWRLLVAWLLGSLRPQGPYPLLVVNGEQGSAKSTTCRLLRSLIDPNQADLRSVPRDERDLVIAAKNSRCIGFDNMSGMQAWLSDALCRVATGSAYATRTLYSDDDETIFSCSRPCIVNGIEDIATRPDLSERAISVSLPIITPDRRRSESDLRKQFEEQRPAILGALLDAVVAALANGTRVTLKELPRMADFASWVVAAEIGGSLPWESGQFMVSYAANVQQSQAVAVGHAAIGPAIEKLLEEFNGEWSGTIGKLLGAVDLHTDLNTRRHLDFPRTARGLANQLRRLAPGLRAAGIGVEFGGHTKTGNIVRLRRSGTLQDVATPTTTNSILDEPWPQ